jgi:hypothetical protein
LTLGVRGGRVGAGGHFPRRWGWNYPGTDRGWRVLRSSPSRPPRRPRPCSATRPHGTPWSAEGARNRLRPPRGAIRPARRGVGACSPGETRGEGRC